MRLHHVVKAPYSGLNFHTWLTPPAPPQLDVGASAMRGEVFTLTTYALRRLMGLETWDHLEKRKCLPSSFTEVYDLVAEVLYGGGYPQSKVGDRVSLATVSIHPGVVKDARMVPLKKWADGQARSAVRALEAGRKVQPTRRNLERAAWRLRLMLDRLGIVQLPPTEPEKQSA